MLEPDRLSQDRHELAAGLRALRRAAGLSGERLAARCAMSQTKISRIETGRAVPTVADVERILTALNAPARVVAEFVDLARVASVGYKSMRAYAGTGMWRAQEEIAALIRSSTTIRQFLPVIPSGLLQTADYAHHVLTSPIPGDVIYDIERVITARLAMQQTLHDPQRQFRFVLTEQAIRWPCAPPDVLAAQCAHIATITELSTVDLAIIPQTTAAPAPMNFFVLYDNRLLAVELFSGEVVYRDPKDIDYHLSVFEFFSAQALRGGAAIALLNRVADEFMRNRD
jgi:transcriptional regulator with XRE-family HTH domain